MEIAGGLFIVAVMGILGLVSSVCGIIVLISAFQDGMVEGLLCLLFPFYILYYCGWIFDHEKRALIITGFVGPVFLLIVIQTITFVSSLS
tara:strand:+ start:584 stop:853 length:270 start_codon:yes stop_codon:yes gene_type:complete